MAFATFLVWRLWTGACGVGAYGFWRYRMPPKRSTHQTGPEFRLTCTKMKNSALIFDASNIIHWKKENHKFRCIKIQTTGLKFFH